ncbi:hypothetical protein ABH984_003832 [Bradyrhizobium ottawaense]
MRVSPLVRRGETRIVCGFSCTERAVADMRQSLDTSGHQDFATMATKLSQPMKWVVLAAIAGVSVFGILTIGPMHEVVAQDRSPIVDVRTSDPEMNCRDRARPWLASNFLGLL